MEISPSLKVEIVAANGEAITIAQNALEFAAFAGHRFAVEYNAVGAAEIHNVKATVRAIHNFGVVTGDALILNNDIVA